MIHDVRVCLPTVLGLFYDLGIVCFLFDKINLYSPGSTACFNNAIDGQMSVCLFVCLYFRTNENKLKMKVGLVKVTHTKN